MNYIELINNLLKEEVSKHEQLVIFGQNVSAWFLYWWYD